MRPWKLANTIALAFACFSACQNVSFAAEQQIGLEAQATALALDSRETLSTASANFATESKNSKSAPAKSASSPKLISKNPVVTKPVAKIATPAQTISTTLTTKTTQPTAPAAKTNSKIVVTTTKPAVTKSAATKSEVSAQKTTSVQTTKKSASITDEKNVSKTSNSETKTSVSKVKPKTRRKTVMLVPPPPPTMPTYLNSQPVSGSFDLGMTVNFMSLDDLKFQQKNLEQKLVSAKQDDKEQKHSIEEKQLRAKRFVELYQEGVVSRRELEAAQLESERSLREIGQTHIKVSEIERVLGQVKERIHSMEKANKPFKLSSKKSKTR
ncbi:MAG: hypothetical protein SGJ27_00170 [Candidatus Melainabacteria bacterium]|nr:hypothetical protein [Candidatus Melainabacteria bacterium]